ncbi:MAG: hypothetical protein Homavirus18_1, partial [Homavirus sp.]
QYVMFKSITKLMTLFAILDLHKKKLLNYMDLIQQ